MPRPADALTVPAEAVCAAAAVLWGDRWQSTMAKELGMNLRTVQRIAAASRDHQAYAVPRPIIEALLRAVERRHFPLQRVYEDLKLIYDGEA